jgi:4-amino-4-deoxy-L-arabinose transferase-like glycosyltransferase
MQEQRHVWIETFPREESIFSKLAEHASEVASLSILSVVSLALSAYRFLEVSGARTLEWDSGAFLTNGGVYAGLSQFSQAYDPTRPPLIPELISVGFRIFGPLQTVGYVVSAAFYLLTFFGAYLLARQLMNPWFALAASVSYGITPTVFEWSGMIVSDVEGVAVASLALATFIMATNGHRRMYLVSLPLLALAGLTRYSLGAVIIFAIVYLIASKKYDLIFDSYEFYYSVGIVILVFIAVGWQWFTYPFSNHETLSVLFPKSDALNPFGNSLGHYFFFANMPVELGSGQYGYLLLSLLVVALGYLLVSALFQKQVRKNAAPLTMVFWLGFMLMYYSLIWPYYDLRYSIEFALPAIILAFWAASVAFRGVVGADRGFKSTSSVARKAAAIFLILVCIGVVLASIYRAETTTVANSPLLESDLNSALRQAVAWVEVNVPTNQKLESNWYTLMWWYAPEYNITAAPTNYQLVGQSAYLSWVQTVTKNGIKYVVYVDPDQIAVPSMLQQVYSASAGNDTTVSVYKVTS